MPPWLRFSHIPGSPAELAGLRVGDTIVAVDGRSVVGPSHYLAPQLLSPHEGRVAELTLLDGRVVTVAAYRD